jgi:hypothetical protein
MDFAFNDLQSFLQLLDPSIGIEPHYALDATFESVSVRITRDGVSTRVGLGNTVEDTVDSIFAEVSERRGRSA